MSFERREEEGYSVITHPSPNYSLPSIQSITHSFTALLDGHKWEWYRFSKPHQVPQHKRTFSKQQQRLYHVVSKVRDHSVFMYKMFPDVEMNYSVKPSVGRAFEVDVFVSSRSIAFEYNGEYHYQFVPVYLIWEIYSDLLTYLFIIHHLLQSATRKKERCVKRWESP